MAEGSKIAVALQWKGPAAQRVELVGDFPNWQQPVPMRESIPGEYECHLKLYPGVYRYQFRINQNTWLCDPHALLTEKTDSFENSLLIVGGTITPAIFAPDRQHWVQREDGRLIVHIEVPAHKKPPSHVCLYAKDPNNTVKSVPVVDVPLLPVLVHKDRVLLQAETRRPFHSKPWTHMNFPGQTTHDFLLPPPRTRLGCPPEWLQSSVFYAIFVDRWHGQSKHETNQNTPRHMPSTPESRYGGDLDGITEHLDYIVNLGMTGIILTPIHCSPSTHRYDGTDLQTIDPALGGEEAFLRLLHAAHQRKLRVIVDISITHIHEQHPAFQDILLQQEMSSYKNWFYIRDFPVVARNGDTFTHYPKHPELPSLNLNPGPARNHVFQMIEKLVRWGVDGLRLDAVEEIPQDFCQELRLRFRAIQPALYIFGEFISDKPAYLAEQQGLDSVTDFQHREAMLAFFGRSSITAQEFWNRQVLHNFRMGPFDPRFRLLFLDNHDTPRFPTLAGSVERLHLALAYLVFRPEPLWLTYGTELALSCGDVEKATTEMWSERIAMPDIPTSTAETALWTPTQRLVKQLLYWRRTLVPFQSSIIRLVQAKEQALVLERIDTNSVIRGYFNAGPTPIELSPLPQHARLLVSIQAQDKNPGELPPLSAQWYIFSTETDPQITLPSPT